MLSLIHLLFFIRQPSDRGWIKQKLSSAQRSEARCFGKPLVPTNEGSHFSVRRIVRFKSKITRSEVKLFIIERVVRYVHLAVYARDLAGCIDNYSCIVIDARRT